MLQTALRPRWIVAFIALLGFSAACIFLGGWQWQRTQDILAVERASLATPVDIAEVLPAGTTTLPVEALGRRIVGTGTYVDAMQTFVVNRELNGEAGAWVVAASMKTKPGWGSEQGQVQRRRWSQYPNGGSAYYLTPFATNALETLAMDLLEDWNELAETSDVTPQIA